jgi:hypothetical protein
MTSVMKTGFPSAELWRFNTNTSTYGWEEVTTVSGIAPLAKFSHVMTSVGLDLWLHGSSGGEGDTCSVHTVLLLLC